MDKELQLSALFDQAKLQPAVTSFEQTKETFLHSLASGSSVNSGKGQLLTIKKWILMLVTISAITLVAITAINLNTTEPNHHEPSESLEINKNKVVFDSLEDKEFNSSQENGYDPQGQMTEQIEMTPIPINQIELYSLETISPLRKAQRQMHHNDNMRTDEPYIPKLTADQIKANNKRKEKMLKLLSRLDKKMYVRISAGSFDYHGTKTSVQSFFMQVTEVTNLEYKTFLFDLLIQGRKDDFLVARPDQSMWTKMLGNTMQPMEEQYFSHEAYADYPVVNISRAGVELYCKWLTIEVLKYDGKRTIDFNDIRLPFRSEWELAASQSGMQIPFPWEGGDVRNESGCFLANFKASEFLIANGESCFNDDSTKVNTIDGALFTARTKTYNPNAYGLYNMSGNVAEMVYNENGQTYSRELPGTAGGGWMSSIDEIKINGPDPYDGEVKAHPNIGFRVVMTHLGRP
ncbi:MAG: SUMF1/EgtB/PvdO family nonheme iron enzyme [Crocinitomicaceae bacterium]|nr:SUMF1/EgtB/PvdO family nonheme iron enzyme [Crocinitomicaceae bacterium]